MTVIGIHPEELFDKLATGELTEAEAERLRAHLQSCDVCRFEYAAREDFRDEAANLQPRLPLTTLPSAERRRPPAGVPTPRRRNALRWSLAAAALVMVTGTIAAALAGKLPIPLLHIGPQADGAARSASSVSAAPPSRGRSRARSSARRASAASSAEMPSAEPSAAAPAPPSSAKGVHAPPAARTPAVANPTKNASRTPATRPSSASLPDAPAPRTAATVFAEANRARRDGQLGRALGLYRRLQSAFPNSQEANLSQVTLATLLLDSGDAQDALTGFERYLSGPSRALEVEALRGRAMSLQRLGQRTLEAAAWRELQRKYPGSVYAQQAEQRLKILERL